MKLNTRFTFRGSYLPRKVTRVTDRLVICGGNELQISSHMTIREIQLAYHILQDILRQNIVNYPVRYMLSKYERRDVMISFSKGATQLDVIYVKSSNNYTVRAKQYMVDGIGRHFTKLLYETSGLNYDGLYQPIKQLQQ